MSHTAAPPCFGTRQLWAETPTHRELKQSFPPLTLSVWYFVLTIRKVAKRLVFHAHLRVQLPNSSTGPTWARHRHHCSFSFRTGVRQPGHTSSPVRAWKDLLRLLCTVLCRGSEGHAPMCQIPKLSFAFCWNVFLVFHWPGSGAFSRGL